MSLSPKMTGRLYNNVDSLGTMFVQPRLKNIYWDHVLAYSFDTRDLWLGKVINLDYARKKSVVRYGIESFKFIRLSERPKIEYKNVKD